MQERYPDATIIATPTAIHNLEQIANSKDFKRIEAKEGMELDIGGYTLKFIIVGTRLPVNTLTLADCVFLDPNHK